MILCKKPISEARKTDNEVVSLEFPDKIQIMMISFVTGIKVAWKVINFNLEFIPFSSLCNQKNALQSIPRFRVDVACIQFTFCGLGKKSFFLVAQHSFVVVHLL